MQTIKEQYCLNPAHPNKKSHTRGLCQSCYASARMLIKRKMITMKELELSGRIMPKKKSGGRAKGNGTTQIWFLAGSPEK